VLPEVVPPVLPVDPATSDDIIFAESALRLRRIEFFGEGMPLTATGLITFPRPQSLLNRHWCRLPDRGSEMAFRADRSSMDGY